MLRENIKIEYRGNLPHIQPIGAVFFVTFRLKGSIPQAQLWKLKKEFEEEIRHYKYKRNAISRQAIIDTHKRYFQAYDKLLDRIQSGNHFLKEAKVAAKVMEQLHRFDGDLYDLLAYCVMSNHVHILIDTYKQIPDAIDWWFDVDATFEPLEVIMKRIKGASAYYSNKALNRKGTFWQAESFDHYVRNQRELKNIIAYILNNPLKAGLVRDWKDHPFTYVKAYEKGSDSVG